MGYCFTLKSFADLYAETFGKTQLSFDIPILKQPHILLLGKMDTDEFALRLWGEIFFDGEKRKFTRYQSDPEDKRTFVRFILEPLYKLYSQV
jgi:U5 small nuclear ribonucleoprotein component